MLVATLTWASVQNNQGQTDLDLRFGLVFIGMSSRHASPAEAQEVFRLEYGNRG